MLQRIYGTAWLTQEELDRHLWRLEEAKKRDHRKLGRELDLFIFNEVSPGAPFWLPHGWTIVRELERFVREHLDALGYQEISTPILVNKKLWEQSGHWDHYADNMFKLEAEDQVFALKPMNCPESTIVYRHALRSYRDLPLRFSDMGRLHRNERSGTLTGLFRVRQFTQDDAHVYCRPDQLQDEVTQCLGLMREWHKTFTLEPSFTLATRPKDSLGTEEQWSIAERALHDALKANGLAYDLNRRRRRVLWSQGRRGRRGRARSEMDDRDHPGGSHHVARALRADLRRRRWPAEAPGGDPPGDSRLVRALHRHPRRALRRCLPDLAGARTGPRASDQREAPATTRGPCTRGSAPPACAPSWTTATRSSVIASGMPRCARCPT